MKHHKSVKLAGKMEKTGTVKILMGFSELRGIVTSNTGFLALAGRMMGRSSQVHTLLLNELWGMTWRKER